MQTVPSGATSLSDEAYGRLRHAILHGDIRPNERLVEAELAEHLGISRTPVRDGLRRLAAEGLVRSRRRGWIVHEHSPLEIAEIYEIRATLEGGAARLAAERAEPEVLAAIALLAHGRPESGEGSAREDLVDLNDAFHEAVLDAAGNERLAHLTRSSREYFFNHDIAALYTDDEARASLEGHRRIAAGMLARDGAGAQTAMREHVEQALALILLKRR